MQSIRAVNTGLAASLCALCLPALVSPAAAQNTGESRKPLALREKPQILSYAVRSPGGTMLHARLQRLPDSAVILDNDNHWQATRGRKRNSTADAEIYDAQLNYSHRSIPDFLWGFPTRGYNQNTEATLGYNSPQSLIYTQDTYTGPDGKTHPYLNFGANIELIEIGQPVQISTLREAIYPVRQVPSQNSANPGQPETIDPPVGGEAVILFWDGVFNPTKYDSTHQPQNGLPTDPYGNYKLAANGDGVNGYLFKVPAGGGVFVINFDKDQNGASHPAGRFQINDPQGRIGMTIAAVYDPAYKDANGQPITSKEDGILLQAVAPNGKNKFYFISDGNYDPASGDIAFDPADNNGGLLYNGNASLFALNGSLPFEQVTADATLNPAQTAGSTDSLYLTSPPYNTYTLLYGTKVDGSAASTGELRGRIRLQGFDPDTAGNVTQVPSPYDITQAVPGERKSTRFRFTFISPPLNAADVNPVNLWDPINQLPAKYHYFQQECYAQPSYGDNADYTFGTHGTAVQLNYRFRGIPTGTYSVLVQAVPIIGNGAAAGAKPVYLSDMSVAYNQYPGSDFAPAFFQKIVIGPSQYVPPTGDSTNRRYDYYTNTVTLDVKLHRPADATDGTNNIPDGVVDIADFGLLINQYQDYGFAPGAEAADFGGGVNGPDGIVDIADFGILVNEFSTGDGTQVIESPKYP